MVEKSLNLKNPEVYRLARQIVRITGESLTQAVIIALRERLARLHNAYSKTSLAEDLMAIGADCASRLSRRTKALDHGKMLYDNRGLPH
jgi:antitoxin VapB